MQTVGGEAFHREKPACGRKPEGRSGNSPHDGSVVARDELWREAGCCKGQEQMSLQLA